MTDPRYPNHDHDPLLIAAHAAGDLTGRDDELASRLVADCIHCSALHADLRALSRAIGDLPPAARRRDYTLSPEDVARLRPTGWRRLIGVAAGPRFSLAGPLGATFASLGVAGLLLASAPALSLGGAAAGPAAGSPSETFDTAAAPEPEGHAAGESDPGVVEQDLRSHGGSIAPLGRAAEEPAASMAVVPEQGFDAREADIAQRSADTTLAILSGSFLIVGLGLFGLRWTARRLDDG